MTVMLFFAQVGPVTYPQVAIGAGGHLQTTLSAGFDSFGEKYSIDEADTLDLTSEVRSIIDLQYDDTWGRGHRFEARNSFRLSDTSRRNNLRCELSLRRRERDLLTLSNELTLRQFDRGEDYVLASDHLQDVVRGAYRARWTDSFATTLRQRFEFMEFAEPSSYEYDYRRSSTSLEFEVTRGLDTTIDVEYLLGFRDVPDSTEVDYVDHLLRANLLQFVGLRSTIDLQAEMGRRRYRDSTQRPGFYLFDVRGRIGVRVGERTEFRLRQMLESYDYDIPGEVYFDNLRHVSGVEVSYEPNLELRLGLEPRYTYLRAPTAPGEEYRETSVSLTGEWLRLDGVWISSSLEVGKRNYLNSASADALLEFDVEALHEESADEIDLSLLYSDYAFTRINLFATLEFWRRYALNLYLSHEPERHADEKDDTTTTLISTDLSIRF